MDSWQNMFKYQEESVTANWWHIDIIEHFFVFVLLLFRRWMTLDNRWSTHS